MRAFAAVVRASFVLDDVLQLDDAEDLRAVGHDQRSAPTLRDLLHGLLDSIGEAPSLGSNVGSDGIERALPELPLIDVDAAHPGLRRERDEGGSHLHHVSLANVEPLLRENDDAPALGRLVREGRELRGVRKIALGDVGCRMESRRLSIPKRDRARLVEEKNVDVAGGFDGAARGRDHVRLDHAVHPGDPDRGEEAADRRRNEAHEEGDEHRDGNRLSGPGGFHTEEREREERDRRQQEDDRQRREQDVERDLVGGLLSLGALDHGDHAVEEGLPRIGRGTDDDPVREDAGAGHDGAAVAPPTRG